MKSDVARLCLGTAQFGLEYPSGAVKPKDFEIRNIIETAHEAGIRWADCAPAYGFQFTRKDWKVVVKFKAADLARVGYYIGQADVIMSHEPKAEYLVRAVKAAGFKGQIGASLYWPDPRPAWAPTVQFPLNLADRRYATLAAAKQYTRFARSVFLQGKLLQMGYTVSQCLGFALRQPVDYVVIGVNSVKELEDILAAAEALPEKVPEIAQPKLTDKELDPRTWGK
jgi:hypothetical protein